MWWWDSVNVALSVAVKNLKTLLFVEIFIKNLVSLLSVHNVLNMWKVAEFEQLIVLQAQPSVMSTLNITSASFHLQCRDSNQGSMTVHCHKMPQDPKEKYFSNQKSLQSPFSLKTALSYLCPHTIWIFVPALSLFSKHGTIHKNSKDSGSRYRSRHRLYW